MRILMLLSSNSKQWLLILSYRKRISREHFQQYWTAAHFNIIMLKCAAVPHCWKYSRLILLHIIYIYVRVFENKSSSYEEQLQEFRQRYISPRQQELTDEFSAVQMQLPPTYHEDVFLPDKLILAADVPHIHEPLLDEVTPTAQEAMQCIAARLSYEPQSAGANNSWQQDECHYSMDRKFGGKARGKFKGYTNNRTRITNLRKLASFKGCWVYGKSHLARDFHSQGEVLDAVTRIKNDNLSSINVTDLLSDHELAPTFDESSEDESEKSPEDAIETNVVFQNLETNLANRAFVHGRSFTEDMHRQIALMNHELSQGEVTKFNGIVIDTGANRASVIRLIQFKEYCKEFSIPASIRTTYKSKSLTGLGGHKVQAIGVAKITITLTDLNLLIDVDFLIITSN